MDHNALLLPLGEAILVRRRRLKLSQEAFGALVGLDRTYIGGIERGERNPTFLSLLAIAGALGISPSELLREAGF